MNDGIVNDATAAEESRFPAQGAGVAGLRAANLVEIFRRRAAEHGQRVAFTFLAGDDTAAPCDRTYAELDQQARAIAAHLQQRCRPLDRVLLMYDTGLDYLAALAGCMYAGVVAVPVFAPDPTRVARTLPRLEAIVVDAQAEILLGTSSDLAWAGALLGQVPGLGQIVPSDEIDLGMAENWSAPQLDRDAPAFLQYTSGSTGTPKGVLVRHGNVLANLAQMEQLLDVEDAIACTWLPAYHDMGLVGGILQCWYSGRRNVMLSPLAFFQQPLRWMQAVSDYRATTIAAPDFAYDLCVRKIKPEERRTLDLSSLQLALSGAEPVRATTIERFVEAFAECGFRRRVFSPCYGMAEATLLITATPPKHDVTVRSFDAEQLAENRAVFVPGKSPKARTLVGCGQPAADQKLVIVDPHSRRRLSTGEVGEIWVSGPNVAAGYWNRMEETVATFHAFTTDGEGPFLRTGDLGFLDGDELFISGRAKDLIIIRGRNFHPQDLEQAVEGCHPAIKARSAVAFSIDTSERERLVIVQEVLRPAKTDLEEVSQAIRRAIFDAYELAVDTVALIRVGTIPKTTSGKLQRRACREQFESGELDVLYCTDTIANPLPASSYVAPRNPLEKELARIWAEVLGHDRVGVNDNFFDLGGTSLLATQLASRLGPLVGQPLPLSKLFDCPTIAQLAEVISAQVNFYRSRDAELLEYLDSMSDEEAAAILAHTEKSTMRVAPSAPGIASPGNYMLLVEPPTDFTQSSPPR